MGVKQAIVVRMRYPDGKGGTRKIRWGKLGAQIAHASWKVMLDRKILFQGESGAPLPLHSVGFVPEMSPNSSGGDPAPTPMHVVGLAPKYLLIPLDAPMSEWVHGDEWKKVILGVGTEDDLLRCYNEAKARGLPAALVTDKGITEFEGVPTHTAVAIGPTLAKEIDIITGRGGLVKTRLL